MRMIFQDPYSSLNPRMNVRSIISEPLLVNRIVTRRAELEERVAEVLGQVGLDPGYMRRYPARLLGRAAAADRHRPGPDPEPAPDRGRRAGERAGRFDPGADPEPSRGAEAEVRPHLPLHRPQPGRGGARERPGGGDVPRQDRGASPRRTSSSKPRCTRTRRRCSPRCRCRTRTTGRTGSSWKARCRAS